MKQDKIYCKYCFNARVYEPTEEELLDPFSSILTDENDFSSRSIGYCDKENRIMVSTGNGEPVRIEVERWIPQRSEWGIVGKYYPKFCPECGRKLNEYNNNFYICFFQDKQLILLNYNLSTPNQIVFFQ